MHVRQYFATLILVCGAAGCLGIEPPFAEEDEEQGLPDGAECEADDDCRSRGCLNHSKLCAPSYCTCPSADCPAGGQASNDCSDNAVCVYYEDIFESVGEVFNVEHDMNGGYCRPLCEKGCPEHYVCGSDGRYCEANSDWAAPSPTITWSGPVSGTVSGNAQQQAVQVEYDVPITVAGSASSPIGQGVMLQWMVINGHAQTMSAGDGVEVTVESGLNYTRVELQAIDEDGRSGLATVIFEGCFGAGDSCGYEGSGCCNGCNRDANTCL
jgi:hypothetical protein